MKDDVVEEIVDEDGNIIETEAIKRVKPVLEILEDDGTAEDDDEDEDEVIEDEESEDDADDADEE